MEINNPILLASVPPKLDNSDGICNDTFCNNVVNPVLTPLIALLKDGQPLVNWVTKSCSAP
ncbi:hypothetical protein H7H82_18750 [Mycobacterium heidelbergense]|uniref:Uncharacterized protein n=1 Tax=Mycobacterium heidelbergense TaxID=53376 RepID=A0A1X0DR83_MYCHE|nr:hypothetical protein [Mycobacterium heidelbergense]MCV7052606.1 hypothetical protein [Mycobacterium heidelbergense]ORA74881.1 hypothetical protein BST25_07065 [Mycobacterium heidelbergense]